MKSDNHYGVGDASYQAAGGLDGITKLVDTFYDLMQTLPETKTIRHLHSDDLTESRKKLTFFLSGWLGGPTLYAEHFGGINIPKAHQHLPVGEAERDAWILCMQKAVDQQPFAETFKVYLIEQLRIPAERIRIAASNI